jgi:hypothetical protein
MLDRASGEVIPIVAYLPLHPRCKPCVPAGYEKKFLAINFSIMATMAAAIGWPRRIDKCHGPLSLAADKHQSA